MAFMAPMMAAAGGATAATSLGAMAAATVGTLALASALKPDTPTMKQSPTMPVADDAAVQARKRKETAAIMARSGRMSTILTDAGSDKLGG